MFYKIKPLDTLFFRDGRPFSMGAETWAKPIFPPYPSTVYGAIRSWLIVERGGFEKFRAGEFKEELGTPENKGSLKIKGPFIGLNNILYFSVPKDLLKEKGKKEKELYAIDLINKSEIIIWEYDLEKYLINKKDIELEETDEMFDIISLKDYLEGKKVELNYTTKEEIFTKEPKTGIKRNRKTLSSEENHLYRISMIRLNEEVSLYVEIEGLNDYPENGIIQLGAEWKSARIEKCDNLLESLKNLKFEFNNKIFKIYLATPAIFENGWLPKWIDEKSLEGICNGINLKLIGCAIGKYCLIGGWDLAKNKPKPMYKAIPAGSVYYFQILDCTALERIKEVFHLKNISDINPEEGFGLSLVGEVSEL